MSSDEINAALGNARSWIAKVGPRVAERLTGVHHNTLRMIRDGKTASPKWETVMRILNAMRDDEAA